MKKSPASSQNKPSQSSITNRKFIVSAFAPTPESFSKLLKQVRRFKKYGSLQMDVSSVASLALHEIPPGGSAWHEYNYGQSGVFKFFPHPKLAPHLPAKWVAGNRKLLRAKVAMLRKEGMRAFFAGYEGYYYPESFFVAHPHLRGPRTDAPRRTRDAAFSACTDLPETLEMISWMMTELKRNVPQLDSYFWRTNDCGGGMCWSTRLYNGANGPTHCEHRPMAERVYGINEAIHNGAKAGGGDIFVRIVNANLSVEESQQIKLKMPPNTGYENAGPIHLGTGTGLSTHYPVLGLLNPMEIIEDGEEIKNTPEATAVLSFKAMYDRANEIPSAVEKCMDILEAAMNYPASGRLARMNLLNDLSQQWAGNKQNGDKLFEAFYQLNEGLKVEPEIKTFFHSYYNGVTMRYITRPLVFRPDILTPKEEAYFLPYVFNISLSEARNDYTDWHGRDLIKDIGSEHRGYPKIKSLQAYSKALLAVAKTLENTKGWPEHEWLKQLATSIRIRVSIMRSCNNFYFAQVIRNRSKEAILAGPQVHIKRATKGHPDLIQWNELLRDEYDNAQELMVILKNGGLPYLHCATKNQKEDMFLLGHDLIGALRKKTTIMRKYWLDVQTFLAPCS